VDISTLELSTKAGFLVPFIYSSLACSHPFKKKFFRAYIHLYPYYIIAKKLAELNIQFLLVIIVVKKYYIAFSDTV